MYSIVYFILGYVVPDLSLSPLCHPQFKKGPPSEIAQVASNFLNQVLHNSGFINLEDLCILEGKFVWVLYIDLTCLNYGGNILDVSVKAMISALKNVKVPHVDLIHNMNENNDELLATDNGIQEKVELKIDGENKQPLNLGNFPISNTICLFDENLLVDPTDEEEDLPGTTNITVVLTPGDFMIFFNIMFFISNSLISRLIFFQTMKYAIYINLEGMP